MNDSGHSPSAGSDLQPDQLIGPVLALVEPPPLLDQDVVVANLLGSIAVEHLLEGDLMMTLFHATNRPHCVRTVLDQYPVA